jgi:uncharacterized protein (TIGR02246 family)
MIKKRPGPAIPFRLPAVFILESSFAQRLNREEIMTTTNDSFVNADRAVRAVLDEVYDAWAENDPDAFVAPYAEGATALLPGTYLQNKNAIRATMADVFAGPLKGSKGIHDVQSIRFIGAGAAIVISKGAILMEGATEPAAETRSLESWVLSEQDGTWRVEAFHNCPEDAA